MTFKKTMMAAVITSAVFSFSAQAADEGHGSVTFKGAIIDASCSIAPESVDQTVELGQIANVALRDGGKSTPKFFDIKLENCEFGPADPNKVSVTFTGSAAPGPHGLLGITGSAQGAGVALTDTNGAKITLGQATNAQALQDGNNTLRFSAYLQGSQASGVQVVPGDFQAVTDFKLSYN